MNFSAVLILSSLLNRVDVNCGSAKKALGEISVHSSVASYYSPSLWGGVGGNQDVMQS